MSLQRLINSGTELFVSVLAFFRLFPRSLRDPVAGLRKIGRTKGTVLFVCQGNICRSPYAEELLRRKLDQEASGFSVESSGLATTPGKPASESAQNAARKRGADLSSHRTTRISLEQVTKADLIVVMEPFHIYWLLRRFPLAWSKTIALGTLSYQQLGLLNVADPYGQTEERFQACFEHIERAVDALAEQLSFKSVLIFDGEQRAALSVARSLGRAGFVVGVCSREQPSIAGSSRYVCESFPSPSPSKAPDEFLEWLPGFVTKVKPDVLLPVTNSSLELVLACRDRFGSNVSVPFVSAETCNRANDKATLLELAKEVGIRIPRTVNIASSDHLGADERKQVDTFSYPACLKPRHSDARTTDKFVKADRYYPQNAKEAYDCLAEGTLRADGPVDYLLQEYVSGVGVGVFALFDQGEPLCTFAHRRVLEKPPEGGVSVLSESLSIDQSPVEQSLALLRKLDWHGVAMVEFKVKPSGEAFLLEINPRFWGSLQLAIDSGRDFPALLCRVATAREQDREQIDREIKGLPPFESGRRLRWLLGTLDHLLIRTKSAPFRTLDDVFARNACRVRFGRKTRLEVCRWNDVRPFATELRKYVVELFRR